MMKLAASVAAVLAVCATAASAQKSGVELGVLECLVDGGSGFIVGSTKDVRCTYTPSDQSFAPETYFGVISKYGLDLGFTRSSVMRWVVLAPSANIYAPGALAGDYYGASADASVAIGGGANILVGRSTQTFTLQPLSIDTQQGINFAVGVTQFQLRSSDS